MKLKQIESKRLEELLRSERKLNALEIGGVDNWDGISFALEQFKKEESLEELIDEVITDIEVELLNGAYEPSERGAGYCSTDEARQQAEQVLRNFLKTYLQELNK